MKLSEMSGGLLERHMGALEVGWKSPLTYPGYSKASLVTF